MLRTLDIYFVPNSNSAIKIFNYIKLHLQEVIIDFDTTTQFVQRKLCFTKDIDILNLDRSNW